MNLLKVCPNSVPYIFPYQAQWNLTLKKIKCKKLHSCLLHNQNLMYLQVAVQIFLNVFWILILMSIRYCVSEFSKFAIFPWKSWLVDFKIWKLRAFLVKNMSDFQNITYLKPFSFFTILIILFGDFLFSIFCHGVQFLKYIILRKFKQLFIPYYIKSVSVRTKSGQ